MRDSHGDVPSPDGDGRRRGYTTDFLTDLFRNPLDPGYAAAAQRRGSGRGPGPAARRALRAVLAVTMAALGFLLVVAYQQTVADEPARSSAHDQLVSQVQRRRADTSVLQDQADGLRSEVADLRDRELDGKAAARLRELEAQTGLAPVRGSGAKITLGDGPTAADPVTGERSTDARVKDTDLQLAANALWAGGAEAIAINGQRLTATSTIRQAGEAILVDFRPVTTPYEVVAIGPDSLAGDFRDGYAGRFFRALVSRYGMSFDTAEVHDVTLAAATELKLRVAEPSTPPPSASTGSQAEPRSSQSEGGR
ncbi:hypothetical protein GCM10012284_53930 [Mangrovihabitans endophyticus]|uniref:DUF881 domain-containing protein n=1 Tax=Mangrovihabitans endophyticus TaxID=1751298 RepID=A0A8J3FRV4_9ACTN|nr:hypothetical protein GCM10012284_53930 [Mangrovihabitans endophyticus]